MRRIGALVQKEFRVVFRTRALVGILFVGPIFQLLVLGYAVTTDVTNVRLAVRDLDRSRASRETADAFVRTGRFVSTGQVDGRREAIRLLDTNGADMVLTIPSGYAAALATGGEPKVQVLIDGQNSNSARVLFGYTAQIIAAAGVAALPVAAGPGRADHPLETRILYNPELRSVVHAVPGIVAILVGLVTLLLTGIGTAREWESGTMEQLLVTPLRPYQIILGKAIPIGCLGLFELVVATLFGRLWFHIPMEGGFPLLVGAATLYVFCALGLGLLISTFCATQLQALFLSWFVSVFMTLLSGLFVPIEQMPPAVRWITGVNPLRYFMTAVREIFLKGSGVEELRHELCALALLALVILSTSVLRFRKRLG